MGRNQDFVRAEAQGWLQDGIIDQPTYDTLLNRYPAATRWDVRTLARWAVLVGSLVLGIGLVSLVTLLIASMVFLVLVLSAGAAAFFLGGLALGKRRKVYLPKTGNGLVTIGCLLMGADVFAVAHLVAPQGDHWEILLLVVSSLYLVIAYTTKNAVVLVLGLLTLATWYGAESGYVSGQGAYFFGMNYPLRFVAAAPLMLLLAPLHRGFLRRFPSTFSQCYDVMGLLSLNLAFWILSLVGLGEGTLFEGSAHRGELAFVSLVWLGLCFGTFVLGVRYQNRSYRGFGVAFLVVNLYTRYFEYFWDSWDKWVFFLVLGAVTLGAGITLERYQRTKIARRHR